MTHFLRFFATALTVLSLTAGCGGGDDAVSSSTDTPASGLWTMDGYRYQTDPGGSIQNESNPVDPSLSSLFAVSFSDTPTNRANGKYAGSSIGAEWTRGTPGMYEVVGDRGALRSAPAGAKRILITTIIGNNTPEYATGYQTVTGQVEVSVDKAGKFHLSTPSPLRMQKLQDGVGVPGAPATMSLGLRDMQ